MYKEFTEESIIKFIVTGTVVLLFLVGLVVFFAILYELRRKKNIQEKKDLQAKFEKELLQTQIEIQEQTLANISRELHDNIGQSLTLAKLNLNTLPTIDNTKASEQIVITKNILSNALTSIRNFSKSMLGEKIAEIGILQAIKNDINILSHTGNYQISMHHTGEPYLLAPQKEIVGFRILQEALHNIIKHAEATSINFDFHYQPNEIIITLVDNGKGFDKNTLNTLNVGVGIKNMYSRASMIHATLHIDSSFNNGTSLSLNIKRH